MAVKAGQPEAARAVAGENLRAKRRTRQNALRGEQLCALRERRADGFGERLAQLVGQPRRDIAFVHHHRHAADGRAEDDRNADKAALGEHDIRLQPADDADALERARDDAEGIGEVFPIEIAAQLAGADRVIGYALHRLNQCALDAVLCADIVNIPALLEQMGDERLIGRDMTGRATAG